MDGRTRLTSQIPPPARSVSQRHLRRRLGASASAWTSTTRAKIRGSHHLQTALVCYSLTFMIFLVVHHTSDIMFPLFMPCSTHASSHLFILQILPLLGFTLPPLQDFLLAPSSSPHSLPFLFPFQSLDSCFPALRPLLAPLGHRQSF